MNKLQRVFLVIFSFPFAIALATWAGLLLSQLSFKNEFSFFNDCVWFAFSSADAHVHLHSADKFLGCLDISEVL